MKALITGGAGFLGSLLAERLLSGPLPVGGAAPADVSELVLLDLVEAPDALVADPRVRMLAGDLAGSLDAVGSVDLILHLAGVVSGAAEADFDLGMATNLDGTRAVLEFARRHAAPPVLLFTSSLAVYGSDPAIGPVGVVDDDTLPRPQSSYGAQKFASEQLVADYGRRGFARVRSVRLMTVSVRPGRPNAAASSFMSSIIREPLAGERAVCPVLPDTEIALASPRRTIEGILRAVGVDDTTWGSRTAMNLPALTTTPREMARALDAVAGAGHSDLIDWRRDPEVEAIVTSWPARFVAERARRLGLEPDGSFEEIVREYVADHVPARP